MKSFTTLLATGTFFAATAFAQESIQSVYDNPVEPSTAADEPTVIVDPLLPTTTTGTSVSSETGSAVDSSITLHMPIPVTTGGGHHRQKKVTRTIDGTIYIPATLCAQYASSTGLTSLIEPTSILEPTTDLTSLIEPTSIVEPTTDLTTLVEPTSIVEPTTDLTSLIEPTSILEPSGYTSQVSDATTTTTAATEHTSQMTDATTLIPSDYTTTDITHPTTTAGDYPSASATAKIQLTKYSEKSRTFDVPVDNTIFRILRHGYKAFEMSLVSADDENVECQGFADKKGLKPLGEPITMDEKADVTKPEDHGEGRMEWVRAVKCSAKGGAAESSASVSSAAASESATLVAPTTIATDDVVPTGYSPATSATGTASATTTTAAEMTTMQTDIMTAI